LLPADPNDIPSRLNDNESLQREALHFLEDVVAVQSEELPIFMA
jgi:hypothetical protein